MKSKESRALDLPKLEPCPFCGRPVKWSTTVPDGRRIYVSIQCEVGCYASEVTKAWPLWRAELLARQWNTRKCS